MRKRLTLPRQRRIRAKADFAAAQRTGRRFGNARFGVIVRRTEAGIARIGLSVAVRLAGGSVERNRLRRIIRESFRVHQHELPPFDLIISARPGAREASPAQLRESLDALWKIVIERCADSSRD